MRGTVLARKSVRDLLKEFVVAELYTDGTRWKDDNIKLQRTRFKQPALPLYLTLAPDGSERSRLLGLSTEAEFIAFLKKGLASTAMK
ncbi:MAG TPA: hypothetical protein VK661_02135 [Planctomycetota bacterium]|nr:hypothetical protein [Planctomycetota bacterium]